MQKKIKKLDQLVSVRGLAAWLVVFYHSILLLQFALPDFPRWLLFFIAQGYLAVDFFFVLSGFIIFINYHSKFFTNFRLNALSFYWNRISRIYPVHLLLLIAYLFLAFTYLFASTSKSIPSGYTVEAFLQSLVLIQAWTGNPTWWNVPSWSISAEWFAYLLFPFITLFFHRLIKGIARHLLLAIGIMVALYLTYWTKELETLGSATFSMSLARATFEFLLGAVAGSLFIHHNAFMRKSLIVNGMMIIAICLALPYIRLPNYATIPLLCFLLVSFLCVDTSIISKILRMKLLVYLGEISYSTYMVHYFVYDVFKAGWVKTSGAVSPPQLFASFFVVLTLSMLIHRAVEMPAQNFLRNGLFNSVRSKFGFLT